MAETTNPLKKPALIICALAFALGWLPRLRWGFWTDEAGTFWLASGGWGEAFQRTVNWAGQSILYSALESFFATPGPWQEPLLRLPSVAAMLIAAWQLKKLAELLIHPEAGWIAVAPFMCAIDIASFATSARPYALALAASLASFRYLLEWQETGRRRMAWAYLASSVLALQLHYLFGFIFVIQALYLAFGWLRGRRIPIWLPLTATVVLPLSLIPVVTSLMKTAKQKDDFAYAVKPAFTLLLQWWFPPVLILTVTLGGGMAWFFARRLEWRPKTPRPEHAFLVVTWLLLAPAVFFLVARLSNMSIFAARYMLFTVPALVLILAWAMHGLATPQSRVTVLMAVLAGTVLHPGMLMAVFHAAPNSWREPLTLVAAQASSGAEAPPVFVTSGVVQSGGAEWQKHDPRTSPLFAALTSYPIPNHAEPLPYQFNKDVERFVEQRATTAYRNCKRLLLLSAADSALVPWMSGYLATQGFQAESHEFGDYTVVDYRRH